MLGSVRPTESEPGALAFTSMSFNRVGFPNGQLVHSMAHEPSDVFDGRQTNPWGSLVAGTDWCREVGSNPGFWLPRLLKQ